MTEQTKPERRQFKAEVAQVLDIVINSLYTHREIFLRELISNASDALEKMRHESLTAGNGEDLDTALDIRIETNSEAHTLTITDTGIGMSHDELVTNLGTIARSGTLEYLRGLAEPVAAGADLIGKFGVGFYSSFMVADTVVVRSRSFREGEPGHEWVSTGVGSYTIETVPDLPRGTSITLHLKEDAREYEATAAITSIIKKYSNFVAFPILVDGERVNTIQAIWLKTPSEVTAEEYTEFARFLTNTDQEPLYHLHISADAPIQLSALFYSPATNVEQYGFMKMKSSVNLYCRKILLQQHVEHLLPEYLRFVTGIVDSADVSLNISRETIQNDAVFRKLGKFLTKRVIKFLTEQSGGDAERYGTFYRTFGMFLKEGAVADPEHREELVKLLRFSSSTAAADTLVSLDEYVARCPETQKDIYYLTGRSREDMEHGPYLETFTKRGVEVLLLVDSIDDFAMTSLGEYAGKRLVSADAADIDLPEPPKTDTAEEPPADTDALAALTTWMKEVLGNRVDDVRVSKRGLDRPVIAVNPDNDITTSMRRIMKAAGRDFMGHAAPVLELNPRHPLIASLLDLRRGNADQGFLQMCVEELCDTALVEAGLLEQPRSMVERIHTIMARALTTAGKDTPVS